LAEAARVALLCHHDTVFPAGTAAERPFRLEGGRCFGPGVADMKGGLAVAVHAARVLAAGARTFAGVELVSLPDEESRLAREALRLARLHGACEGPTLQVTGLEAGEGLNAMPSSGSRA